MHCEQATALISARLDHEIDPDETKLLDEHLRECPACQATAEAFALQDQELRQAMESRRAGVGQVARNVATQIRPMTPPRHWLTQTVIGVTALAACVIGVLLYRHFFIVPVTPEVPGPLLANLERITPQKMKPIAPPQPVQVGDTIATGPAERLRRVLPDGSILYVDRGTAAKITGERTLTVERGNVYVEVAPSEADRFTVATPTREVVAHGTRFEVQVAEQGTGVVVTQGQVKVNGLSDFLVAGQQVLPGKDTVESAPRTSHLLDWTQDLMAQATTALVPASQHQGGSLVAFDTNGQEAKLSLRRYHVDVHIEDGFARTTIDQTYFNHHPWRLEGTFYFPLPADASLSQLTMYVNGERQEGGMVERKQGRAIYNKIVSSMRDPALLEWVDGTTFKMRVFPLEGRQEKRILLSYTQRLPSLYGRTTYRFPAGHSLQVVRDWSFQARIKDGQGTHVICPSHPDMTGKNAGTDLVLSASARAVKVDRDVVLHLSDGGGLARGESLQFRHRDHDGYRYLMARWRPELTMTTTRQRRDWVVLYEASADRDPLLARVQIEVFRHLMSQAEHDDTFTILAANSRVHRFGANLPATPENVTRAVAWLENTHLIGALDLGQAFEQAGGILNGLDNPHLVHLGSGHPGMGRTHERLAEVLPAKAKYVAVGVGKRWARAFMKGLAEKTGGLVTQINPDEPIAWRTFELLATLNTPRLLGLTAKFDGINQPAGLADQAMLAQGEDLCVVSRVPGAARLPARLVITATLDGQPYRRVLNVDEGQGDAGYLPRQWARLEIDRLLADGAQKNHDDIVQLSKDAYVLSPFTSLLVLENEAMYREFNVEPGRKDHWAAFDAPDKIPVVYEPDPTQLGDIANAPRDRKPSEAEILNTLLSHTPARLLRGANEPENDQAARTVLNVNGKASREGFLGEDRRQLWHFSRLTESEGLYTNGERANDLTPQSEVRLQMETLILPELAFGTDGTRLATSNTLNGGDWAEIAGRSRVLSRPGSGTPQLRFLSPTLPKVPQLDRLFRNVGQEFDSQKREGLWDERTPRGPIVTNFSSSRVELADRLAALDSDGVNMFARQRFDVDSDLPDAMGLGLMPTGAVIAPNATGLHYQRLVATQGTRRRDDLLGYAAGLNTSAADIRVALEAEAVPELRNVPGRVDPQALALINRARQGGWMRFTPTGKDGPSGTFLFDASGRFVRTRTLPIGLKEEIVCDGDSILSLYPELGLAGRRVSSRHHRAELASLPHVVLPAADLAHGHDVEVVAERTVAIVPHDIGDRAYLQSRLVFAADGELAERQLVRMPERKVLLRQILLADGYRVVGFEDDKEKELGRVTYTLTPVEAPTLQRDLAKLVVLELPFRSRNVLLPRLNLNSGTSLDGENGCYRYLSRQEAVQLLALCCIERNVNDAWRVLNDCFLDHDDLRPGLLVLAASAGMEVGRHDRQRWFTRFAEAHPDSEIVRYFAVLHNAVYRDVRQFWPTNLTRGVGIAGDFLPRLARFHELFDRWDGQSTLLWDFTRRTHLRQALAFIAEQPESILARALLVRMQWQGNLPPGGWRDLAAAWKKLDQPGERYRAQYERAACLRQDGQIVEAREAFLAVAELALDQGTLPPIDDRFHAALSVPGPDNPWTKWVLTTTDRLLKAKNPITVLDLASRCRDFGDPALADNLIVRVLTGIEAGSARINATAAVVERLLSWGQPDTAEEHLATLLKAKELHENPQLYRLAARVAEARGQTARMFEWREKALDLEHRDLPAVIDLESWRNDYRPLLDHYLSRAQVLADLGDRADAKARQDLIRRTVLAMDRYRQHDPEAKNECPKAALILRLLGANDLAWDYQTTPQAGREEPTSLHGEALALARAGAFSLAERMFRVCCDAEPTSAAIWWDRAAMLARAGRLDEADAIRRDLADGKLAPEDRLYRERAAWLLKNR